VFRDILHRGGGRLLILLQHMLLTRYGAFDFVFA
jgi:hypothetical protein